MVRKWKEGQMKILILMVEWRIVEVNGGLAKKRESVMGDGGKGKWEQKKEC